MSDANYGTGGDREAWANVSRCAPAKLQHELWLGVIRAVADAVVAARDGKAVTEEDEDHDAEGLISQWLAEALPVNSTVAWVMGELDYFRDRGFGWDEELNLAGPACPSDLSDIVWDLHGILEGKPDARNAITEGVVEDFYAEWRSGFLRRVVAEAAALGDGKRVAVPRDRWHMELETLIRGLSYPDGVVRVSAVAERDARDCSGLYAIFVDRAQSLPEPYRGRLVRDETTLLYIGKASGCLYTRLVGQDLRHTSPSTFFRGIGAVLGFRPVPGSLKGKANQNNYQFSAADTQRIIDWIDEHVRVRYVKVPAADVLAHEAQAIRELRPLLNATHNPAKMPELSQLRLECRRIACA